MGTQEGTVLERTTHIMVTLFQVLEPEQRLNRVWALRVSLSCPNLCLRCVPANALTGAQELVVS